MKKYDLTVVGAGPGGYVAAIRAAQLGAKVCLIEKDKVGGTCLHRGCIPSKNYLTSVKTLKTVLNASTFGIDVNGDAKANLGTIRERTAKVISGLEKGVHFLIKSNGIDFMQGSAAFESSNQLSVTSEDGSRTMVETGKVIIAAGSSPIVLPHFEGIPFLNTDTVFALDAIPSSITIIGGGVTGCEFATIFNGLGSRVTILEMESRLLPGEEEGIVRILQREFKKKKTGFLCGIKISSVTIRENMKVVILEDGQEVESDQILVTVGRRANTTDSGLEKTGVKLDPKGNILVNKKMETSANGIYAVGDVTGKWLLAHAASKEGIVAAENAMGMDVSMDYSAVPATVFTDPEIGSVGLSASQAEEKGFKVKVGSFPMRNLGKSQITNELAGEVQLTIEDGSGKLLGARMIGASASELIHEATLAISNKMTVKDVGETVHSHPTLSEAIMEAAWSGYKGSVHGG